MDNIFKHKSTLHHSFSGTLSKGDEYASPDVIESFEGQQIIITEKMDGGASSFTKKEDGSLHINLRSLEQVDPADKKASWLCNYVDLLKEKLPLNFRFSGEILKWKHSIYYDELPSFFMLYRIWNDKNVSLGWDELTEWTELLDIPSFGIDKMYSVPLLYRGIYDNSLIKEIFDETVASGKEGIIVQLEGQFPYPEDIWYYTDILKLVRKGHVQTDEHWSRHLEPNQLEENSPFRNIPG